MDQPTVQVKSLDKKWQDSGAGKREIRKRRTEIAAQHVRTRQRISCLHQEVVQEEKSQRDGKPFRTSPADRGHAQCYAKEGERKNRKWRGPSPCHLDFQQDVRRARGSRGSDCGPQCAGAHFQRGDREQPGSLSGLGLEIIVLETYDAARVVSWVLAEN